MSSHAHNFFTPVYRNGTKESKNCTKPRKKKIRRIVNMQNIRFLIIFGWIFLRTYDRKYLINVAAHGRTRGQKCTPNIMQKSFIRSLSN